MEKMTARERVRRTFQFDKTDRVARYEIFLPEFTEIWRERRRRPGADPYDTFSQVDIGTILADQSGPLRSSSHALEDRGDGYLYLVDGFGRTLRRREGAYFEEELGSVLANKALLDDLVFDDPLDASRYTGLEAHTRSIGDRFAPVSGVLGLYMSSFRMRGQQEYLEDMAGDMGFCRALADRLGEFITAQGLEVAKRTHTLDTAIWVYDEFSAQRGPMFSPHTYETLFMPVYQRMFARWRENGITNIVLHCDGNCLPLMDLILETGFNAYQSPAPSAGMVLPALKKRYGNRLVLIGGMCNIHTLATGSKLEIARETLEILEAAQDGGVIIGTHSIDKDIPVENYEFYDRLLSDFSDEQGGVEPLC